MNVMPPKGYTSVTIPDEICQVAHEFYRKQGIESPGVEPADFAKVVVD